jgi:hypothetical protein
MGAADPLLLVSARHTWYEPAPVAPLHDTRTAPQREPSVADTLVGGVAVTPRRPASPGLKVLVQTALTALTQ